MPPHIFYAACGLLVITVSFVNAALRGRAYRMSEDAQNKYGTGRDEHLLDLHRQATNFALIYVLLGIFMIEFGVQLRPPESEASLILWVHLPLAIGFFGLLLALRFWLTGLHSVHHARFGRLCAALFAGTLGTGAVMLAQM